MWRSLRTAARALAPLALASGGGIVACQADDPLATTFPYGLTGAGASAKFYTDNLDLESPLLLRRSRDFMAAARADARERLGLPPPPQSAGEALALEESVREHLASAIRRCTAFLDSGVVHDREELRGALEGVLGGSGQLALLLGGKSVGKSLLLAELARRTDLVGVDGATRAVLYVDARKFSTDLAAGLQAALEGETTRELERSARCASLGLAGLAQRRRAQDSRGGDASSSQDASAAPSAKLKGIALQAKLRLVEPLTPMQRNLEMLSSVAELAEAQGLYMCLVVDEANLAFPTPPSQHPGAVPTPPSPEREKLLRDTQLLLERLVLLTKQSRTINALIVSSEYGYSFRLRHDNFFNTTNLTASIFAGEVPPADMRRLLTDSWGLGPRLADVFLAHFGGHVHMASQALPVLAVKLDAFRCEAVAPDGAVGAIVAALGSSSSAEGRGKAALLRSAAQCGFARVQQEGDASAQALARANLGGLLTSQGQVVGVPDSVRGDANFGFVPSSHFLRNLVARELHAERKAAGWLGWLRRARWPWES